MLNLKVFDSGMMNVARSIIIVFIICDWRMSLALPFVLALCRPINYIVRVSQKRCNPWNNHSPPNKIPLGYMNLHIIANIKKKKKKKNQLQRMLRLTQVVVHDDKGLYLLGCIVSWRRRKFSNRHVNRCIRLSNITTGKTSITDINDGQQERYQKYCSHGGEQ
jgi:hypothetical protein